MKKRLPMDSSILEFFVLIFLVMASLFYLNGCTNKAMQIAEHKASPENIAHWKIRRVVSAVKHQNSDISVCIELIENGEIGEPRPYTISLPLSGLAGDTAVFEKLSQRLEECFLDDASCYGYPIEKTESGCESVAPGISSSTSDIPVEKISVNTKSRHQLYNLIFHSNKNQPIKERIFEADFEFDEEDTEKNADKDKVLANRMEGTTKISLIYWSDQINKPIIITGVYEDNRTRLYYLMVPLAVAGDLALEITIMAARVSLCIASSGRICE